jgi:mono/diheme cytochrome c family protein
MKLKPVQLLLLVAFGTGLLTATGWTIVVEIDQPWRRFQKEFTKTEKDLLLEKKHQLKDQKKGASEAASKKLGAQTRRLDRKIKLNQKRSAKIDQMWIEDIKRADRCMTCHSGVEKAVFAQFEGVYGKHPSDFLKTHPIKNFGCTLCHDGDGMGLTVSSGHGQDVHWNRPLLSGELVQSSCRRCHPYNEKIPQHVSFPQAPVLSRGKDLYIVKGCRGCHELADFERPESIAPALSRVGEKVNGDWLAMWMKRPKDYLPDTIMPFFDLPPEEIEALKAFLLRRKEERVVLGTNVGPANSASGKKLMDKIGCLGCHRIAERGETFGPDLSRVAEKINPHWPISWIKNPLSYDPKTVMPDFRLQDDQVADMAAYLFTLGVQAKGEGAAPDPGKIDAGKKLFGQRGCTGCHTMEGFALGFKKAPEHTGFGDKRVDELDFGNVTDIPRTRADWVLAKEISPRVFSTETIRLIMPNFELSDQEAEALRVFVLSFTEQDLPVAYRKTFWTPDDPYLAGMRTVETFNCIGCHKIGLVEKPLELTEDVADKYFWSATNYVLEDIASTRETQYGKGQELSDLQLKALVDQHPETENLLFRQRWFLDLDTVEYLKLDMGFKSINASGMDEGQILANYKDLNFGPPILNYEGIKVQPNWLFQFLKAPYPIRPLTKATMPTFDLAEDEIVNLVGFFQARDGINHNPFFTTPELQRAETDSAEKIFKVCLQCHYFDQERTQSKDRFGDLKGPNLAEAKRRLRPEYIKRWIKYPELVIPGTQMKNFFYYFDIYARFEKLEQDETGFPEIPPDKKIDMMAQFLMNPFMGSTMTTSRLQKPEGSISVVAKGLQ